MKRLFLPFVVMASLAVISQAARNPVDFYRGQEGGVDSDIVETLKKDIPLAKRVLDECRSSSVVLERRSCVNSAYYIESPELIEPLREYLRDSNSDVRREAMQSLALIAGEKIIPWISPLADDPHPFTREAALLHLSNLGGRNVHPILQKRLSDSSPHVKLRAAMLLAADGETVPRALAIAHISTASVTTSDAIGINKKALLLLGFVGNESDVEIFNEVIGRRRDYNAGDAMRGRQQLRLKYAKTQNDRERILDESFRDTRLQDWVLIEVFRRYRSGDKSMRDFAKRISEDTAHPGSKHGKGALRMINGVR